MPMTVSRNLAVLCLVAACLGWALSFPVMKGLALYQTILLPGAGSWFISSWCLALRFGLAGVILALVMLPRLKRFTRREAEQAAVLGLITAGGMLLQMDGLSWTEASTSAFLTQGYAVFIPLWFALRHWRRPHVLVIVAVLLVVLGCGILAQVDPARLALGRGELETLAAAAVFTVQILLIESPRYAGNDPLRMSSLAFAITGIALVPVALASAPSPDALWLVYAQAGPLICLGMLVLFSTLGAMVLMFVFQPRVGALAAGITYGCEPVFASALAMILPAWLSGLLGISYANETLTPHLILGGALVLAAVVLIQFAPKTQAPARDATRSGSRSSG